MTGHTAPRATKSIFGSQNDQNADRLVWMVEFDRFCGQFSVYYHFKTTIVYFSQNKMSKCKSILYKDDQNYQKTEQRNQVQVRIT